jgi:hypothetical protein
MQTLHELPLNHVMCATSPEGLIGQHTPEDEGSGSLRRIDAG